MTDMPLNNSTQADPSARFWDRQARKYAKSKIGDMAGYEKSIARTRDFLSSRQDVLEIGCGTGTTALHHAAYVGHITGTDISSEMVAIANEKTDADGALNAEFVVADAEELPFANGAFDVVMGHNIYHLIGNIDKGVMEAHRVLKTGGIFISKTPCLKEMNAAMRYGLLPIMKLFYRVPHLGIFNTEELKGTIAKAGFEITHVEHHGTKGKDMRPFIVARKV